MFDKKKYMKQYNQQPHVKKLKKQWRENNPDYMKQYQINKIDKIKEIERLTQWNKNNPERKKEAIKRWVQNNKEKYLEYHRKWKNNKRRTDSKFRLDNNMGSLIWRELKNNKNGRRWSNLLSYTIEDLMKHLEKQFKLEMNWDNYGSYWEVDHIIPRSVFNYSKSEDIGFQQCWALNNLQPLEMSKNRKKYNKLMRPFQLAFEM